MKLILKQKFPELNTYELLTEDNEVLYKVIKYIKYY